MKTLIFNMTFLIFLFDGCSSHAQYIESQDSVDEVFITENVKLKNSFIAWNKLKESMGISYQYGIKNAPGWGGLQHDTTITVKDDFVTNRHHMTLDADNVILSSWKEDGFDALNDHVDGASVKTIDELYQDCAKMFIDRENVEITFDESGILKTCHFGRRGIYIDNIIFLSY